MRSTKPSSATPFAVYAKTYLAATPPSPAFIAIDTLPADLRDTFDRVQERVSRPVWLIDITTDLGVPATLAYAPGPRGNYLSGRGTSLSHRHSVFRALTELLECELTDDRVVSRIAAIEQLADYPAPQAAAALELPGPTDSARRVPFVDTPAPTTPDLHLKVLLDALASRGFAPYVHRSHTTANGICAVHVHIPGLERFHLISDGPSAVVPGERAMTAIEADAA